MENESGSIPRQRTLSFDRLHDTPRPVCQPADGMSPLSCRAKLRRTTTEPSECCIGSSRDAERKLQERKARLTCLGRVLLADLLALGRRRPPFDVHMLYGRRMAVHGATELLEEGWRSPKLLRNATGIRGH